MTVAKTHNRKDYIGSGGNKIFAFDFKIYDETDLLVYVNNILAGPAYYPYTVSGGPTWTEAGGNVVFTTAPDGLAVLIYRELTVTQGTEWPEGGPFPSKSHENAADRLVMLAQQFKEAIGRVFKVVVTSLLSDIEVPEGAGKLWGWNAAGDGAALYSQIVDTGVITTKGDIIYGSVSGMPERLPVGDLGDILLAKKIGSELISNGGFDTNTDGWGGIDCTIASVAGGQSGNCLEITRTGAAVQSAYAPRTFIEGKVYRVGIWVKSGTSGNESFKICKNDIGEGVITGTSSAMWVYYETIFTATAQDAGDIYIYLMKLSATPGTMLFDSISIRELNILPDWNPSTEIKLDDWGTPDDNTDLDALITKHGLMSKADKIKLDGIGLKRRIVFPAACFETRAAANWAAFVQMQGANFDYGELDFDAASQERADSPAFRLTNWNGGSITLRIGWKAAAIAGDVIWSFYRIGRAAGEQWDFALVSTDLSPTTVNGVTEYLNESVYTGTPGGWAIGDAAQIIIQRMAALAGDTMVGDAKLLYVELEYTEA